MPPNLNKYKEEDEDMYEDDSNGELEEVLTDNSQAPGLKKKVMRWKKWLRKKKRDARPNESDILLAKAYGGKPKASGKGKDGMSRISSRANMPPISNRFFDEDRNLSKSKRTHVRQDS